MSYILKKTNGQVLVTLQDGTLDTTSTPLTLIGKNYPGYGLVLNDDFVGLLENFANSTPPSNPLLGQLWYDTTNAKLTVYNGNLFKVTSSINTSNSLSTPAQNTVGDFWFQPDTGRLYLYDGLTYVLIGPSNGSSGTFSSLTVLNDSNIDGNLYVSGSIFDNNGQISAGSFKFSGSNSFASILPNALVFTDSQKQLATNAAFTVNTSTGTLTTGNLIVNGNITLSTAEINALTVGQGVVGAPSIGNVSDPTTGVWFPGSGNSFAVSTIGVERLFINSSGQVGIATNTPIATLDVHGNIALTATAPNIQFNVDGPQVYVSAANTLSFATAGTVVSPTESMRLTSTGQLAIGTLAGLGTVPDTLSVYASTLTQLGLRSGAHAFTITNNNDGSLRFKSVSPAVELLTMNSASSMVGINKTAPAYTLDVGGNINFSGNLYQNGVIFTPGGGGGGGGSVTSIVAAAPLTGGTITSTGTIGLSTTGVTAGTVGGTGQMIQSLTVDAYGRISTVSAVSQPTYTPSPPALYHVTSTPVNYTVGGRVAIKSTAPTAADFPGGAVLAGDIWFDPSGSTGYTQSLSSGALGTSGWTQLPNGIIMNWGYVQTGTGGSGIAFGNVTFPKPFPNHAMSASCNTERPASLGAPASGSNFISNLSTTGMTVGFDTDGSKMSGYWFAIGY